MTLSVNQPAEHRARYCQQIVDGKAAGDLRERGTVVISEITGLGPLATVLATGGGAGTAASRRSRAVRRRRVRRLLW